MIKAFRGSAGDHLYVLKKTQTFPGGWQRFQLVKVIIIKKTLIYQTLSKLKTSDSHRLYLKNSRQATDRAKYSQNICLTKDLCPGDIKIKALTT